MRKPGEWIATMNAALEVSRVSVEASEALDAVGLWVGGRDGRADHVHYFDRVEAARLRDQLGAALDALERAAIDAPVDRYVPISCLGGYRIFDKHRGFAVPDHVFPSLADAGRTADWWNRLEASETDHRSQAGPARRP